MIGLDGLEPSIVEPMLAAGELPHLASLRGSGDYRRLATTTPAQTPVAWSTFATGTNPGAHGIFDFVSRDPARYLPDLALNRYEQPSALLPPRAVNRRQGEPVWTLLADAGVPAVVLRCPCSYPPDRLRGRQLAGVGVPDLRGGLGTPTFFTQDPEATPGESERLVRLEGGQQVKTALPGPRRPGKGDELSLTLTIRVDPAAGAATVSWAGKPRTVELRQGEWSGWLKVPFKAGLLQTIRGMVRLRLVRCEPLELYASPINFDADWPLFPISQPGDYAAQLAADLGPYYTTGMVEDHTGLGNGRFDEAAYIAHCDEVMRERERMFQHELGQLRSGLLFCLFDTPDRLQHMLWRFREPEHPANAVHGFDASLAGAIEEHYRACDRMLGRALGAVDDQTLLLVASDHGMTSFQRGVHLNGWLASEGLLATEPGADAVGELFEGVRWGETRAYALGLGGIYLNRRGREAEGVVADDEVDALASRITSGLEALRDPERDGAAPIARVRRAADCYRGEQLGDAPDLLVDFEPGWRVSWETCLGGGPRGLFADNTHRWGGDHCVDPRRVPGVLFANRKLAEGEAGLVDLAPTLLAALGAPPAAAHEGRSLLP